jgi:hypothetical protein
MSFGFFFFCFFYNKMEPRRPATRATGMATCNAVLPLAAALGNE